MKSLLLSILILLGSGYFFFVGIYKESILGYFFGVLFFVMGIIMLHADIKRLNKEHFLRVYNERKKRD
jgi:uncharacterized membrane protein HdeD (DUF308 family)